MSPIAVQILLVFGDQARRQGAISQLPLSKTGVNPSFDAVQQSLRQSMGPESDALSLWQFGLLIVAVLGLVLLLRYVSQRLDSDNVGGKLDSPAALFRELAAAHELTRSQRHVLLRIARDQKLADPARLFLEPDRLVTAANLAGGRSESGHINALGLQLFGDIRRFAQSEPGEVEADEMAPVDDSTALVHE